MSEKGYVIKGAGKPKERFLDCAIDANYAIGDKGTVYSFISGREVGVESDHGYRQVWISSKSKWYKVHSLQWLSFFGNIPCGYEVDHRDNRRGNNILGNLQLLSSRDNKLKSAAFRASLKNVKGNVDHTHRICQYTSSVTDSSLLCVKNLPRGENHHKFLGFFKINGCVFDIAKEAASLLGISAYRLRELCKRDLAGFSFHPKEEAAQMLVTEPANRKINVANQLACGGCDIDAILLSLEKHFKYIISDVQVHKLSETLTFTTLIGDGVEIARFLAKKYPDAVFQLLYSTDPTFSCSSRIFIISGDKEIEDCDISKEEVANFLVSTENPSVYRSTTTRNHPAVNFTYKATQAQG
ncbi:HNH endonuclease signature motif containing protein [Pedobacter sp. SYSU D00535]|uniref:HNH endonuclease signature motif containing protein n=1 Tax=Pedobacter sp. SYSU D00535 TaxID=2810308 RepID=UPI001A96586E|nr:HNH endonuclease signature motif containing protein [Pedobacter sp. SYSU D00535]